MCCSSRGVVCVLRCACCVLLMLFVDVVHHSGMFRALVVSVDGIQLFIYSRYRAALVRPPAPTGRGMPLSCCVCVTVPAVNK